MFPNLMGLQSMGRPMNRWSMLGAGLSGAAQGMGAGGSGGIGGALGGASQALGGLQDEERWKEFLRYMQQARGPALGGPSGMGPPGGSLY